MSRNEEFRTGHQTEVTAWGKDNKTGKRRQVGVGGRVVEESETHLTIERAARGGGTERVRVHKDNIVSRQDAAPRNSRSAEDRNKSREELLGKIGEDWGRVPDGFPASDIDHLIKQGHIESKVETEYDSQGGRYAQALFGGAGTVQRKRKYVRRKPS